MCRPFAPGKGIPGDEEYKLGPLVFASVPRRARQSQGGPVRPKVDRSELTVDRHEVLKVHQNWIEVPLVPAELFSWEQSDSALLETARFGTPRHYSSILRLSPDFPRSRIFPGSAPILQIVSGGVISRFPFPVPRPRGTTTRHVSQVRVPTLDSFANAQ